MNWLKTHWHLTIILIVVAGGIVWGVIRIQSDKPITEYPPPTVSQPSGADSLPSATTTNTAIPIATTTEELTSSIDTLEWETYENNKMGFIIDHPKDFSFTEGKQIEDDKEKIDTGCYLLVMVDGGKFCDNKGNVYFEFDPSFRGGTSKEAFEYIYTKIKEEREVYDRGDPRLLGLVELTVNGEDYIQAKYFGGDSVQVQTYIPTTKGLLIYNYNVAPTENDPDTVYHEEVSKAILLSLEVFNINIDYCSIPPVPGDDALFGIDIYPSDPKYKSAGWMAPVFTELDCGGEKINKIFGVRDGMYWPGSNMVFRAAPSPDLIEVLKGIGYEKGTMCIDVSESECSNWRLEREVPVSDIMKLKPYINMMEYNECVNCG